MVRSVGGVCGMCLARGEVGGVGGEWVTGLGLGFTNSGGTWGKWDMCVFWLRWCGWCGWCGWCWVRVGWRPGPGSGRVGWCYVGMCCESGFSVLMAGPGICILC